MLEQRIQQQFFESADLQYQVADVLARPLAAAAQTVFSAITGGAKLLVAGTGNAAGLAPHLVSQLVGGFERERPPLAAFALPGRVFEDQVQALGQPGDVLLLIDAGDAPGVLRKVIAAAQSKEMVVVALAGAAPEWADALAETDVLVAAPVARPARLRELQLLMLHALCDAIDLQLMGEQESE